MYITNLRKVGGSLMFAVPPALLDILHLHHGSKVGMTVEDGKLVIKPKVKPRYTMAELLAVSDYSQSRSDSEREFIDSPAVGGEIL